MAFVALPPTTKSGCVVFGKNTNRPKLEVQEVVYYAAKQHQPNSTVDCTYVTIPQVTHTAAVVLSKPAWTWGAATGSNEHGVCISVEAIQTKLLTDEATSKELLLGVDLVRLGLERSTTAKQAVDVITSLLEAHGQGGLCCDDAKYSTYAHHNSFLIADKSEAWVVETADREWAAERVTGGVRSIGGLLTIGTKIDAMSQGLQKVAEEKGLWKSADGEFDFAKAFSASSSKSVQRYQSGKDLLNQAADAGNIDANTMFQLLRNKSLCVLGGEAVEGSSPPLATMGSQVSVIKASDASQPSVHWFTATPNPRCSVFKPFIFVPNIVSTSLTISPTFGDDDPAKKKPRFEKTVDRRHALFRVQETIEPLSGDESSNGDVLKILQELETGCVADLEAFLDDYNAGRAAELTDLFKDVVESEMKFYRGGAASSKP